MLSLGLNQMTMARASISQLLDVAQALGCVGVELRNDLAAPLFDGLSASKISDELVKRRLRILALAEVYAFNDNSETSIREVQELLATAQTCGAEAIVLIPRIAGAPLTRADQRDKLHAALTALLPIMRDTGVTALIEPLGFINSSLRFKADAVAVLDEVGTPDCFGLIHDTFHHHLTGETEIFPVVTRIVHVSGVNDPSLKTTDMADEHRGLVAANDRLGSIAQIKQLQDAGYTGPLSHEAFAPDVHGIKDPTSALAVSNDFIASELAKEVA